MKKGFAVKDFVQCAFFAAFCCICSMISIPVGAVPMTFATLGIMVTSMILGLKKGLFSVALFIILGLIGQPVFSGFQGGVGAITGPTGGFIYSYLLMVIVIGVSTKLLRKTVSSISFAVLGNIVALIICYIVGALHFSLVTETSLYSAFAICVLPFVVFDLLKMVVSIIIAVKIKQFRII